MLPTAVTRPFAAGKALTKVIAKGSPKLLQFLGIAVIGVASLLGSSCSFMGFSPSPVSQKRVNVSPPAPTVASGGRVQFAATIQNTWNPAVVWSAQNGVISRTGLFMAPTVTSAKAVIVTARSVADPDATTSVAVYVTPAVSPNQLAITSLFLPQLQPGIPYVATLTASGGKTPYTWSLSSGSFPSGLSLNPHTGVISGITVQGGTAAFTVKVADTASHISSQPFTLNVSAPATGNTDGPAELPRVYIQNAMANTPAPGKTTLVKAGGDLQAALNGASCGDTIQLQAGASFSGVFTFPAKSCDDNHWIIIRTSAPDSALPPEGTRITPCFAGISSLPGRPPFTCVSAANVMAKIAVDQTGQAGPLIFAPGANHFRLLGLEVTRPVSGGIVYTLSHLQKGGPADHIVFDRVWMHGTALDETTRGIDLGGSRYVAIVDSFFTDFHCTSTTGTCTDAQAVMGGIGNLPMGPYKIVDNFLEAAAEAILFGGDAATSTPADIEVRRNHFFKPLIWQPGRPGFLGVSFIVKNHFELKNAQRVLLEGNIMENTWGGFSQAGYSIVVSPKNSYNQCPSCLVTDVTIRLNRISHAGAGMNFANALSDAGGAPRDGQRYSVHDDILDDIDPVAYKGAGAFAQVSVSAGAPVIQHIWFDHITAFAPTTLFFFGDFTASNPQMADFRFTNNIVNAGIYPVWSTGDVGNCAIHAVALTSLNACFSSWVFNKNALVAIPTLAPTSSWPVGNFFPTNGTAVQFVKYNNGNSGDYHLLSSSPFKNAGLDGKDLGANIDAVLSTTAGVY